MPRIVYVNGRYLPYGEAAVHVEDRGYQFSDGVYEVIAIHDARLVYEDPHLDRLERSLGELRMAPPMPRAALKVVLRETIRRGRARHGLIYIQVTRGVAPRNHAFPEATESSLVVMTQHAPPFDVETASLGLAVITIPDIRWKRPDIKSVSLLPNVLGKQQAVEADAYEAWQVDDGGRVTEGTLSNAWIVSEGGELITRDAGKSILDGITRQALLDMARREGIRFQERAFTVDEARAAKEAFLTSSSGFIKPVIRIDGRDIGEGKTGPLTRKILGLYADHLETLGPPS